MKASRRIGVPQRRHGWPARPYESPRISPDGRQLAWSFYIVERGWENTDAAAPTAEKPKAAPRPRKPAAPKVASEAVAAEPKSGE